MSFPKLTKYKAVHKVNFNIKNNAGQWLMTAAM